MEWLYTKIINVVSFKSLSGKAQIELPFVIRDNLGVLDEGGITNTLYKNN